jgi:hypothetical protein
MEAMPMTQEQQYERIIAHSNGNLMANCEECGKSIPVELTLCDDCVYAQETDISSEEWADNSGGCCPDCETPNQFGELCSRCISQRACEGMERE